MINNHIYDKDLMYINNFELPWERLDGKAILVTGGSGLIGSTIIDAIIYRNEKRHSGIDVWVLSRNEKVVNERFGKYFEKSYFHYLCQDVCEKINIPSEIEYIVHGAGKGDPNSFASDPVGVMNANYMGMYQVLELAREQRTNKVVYISSGEVYGDQSQERRLIEGVKEADYGYVNLLDPRACYASSKRAAETLCAAYRMQYGVNVSIARPCHTYGAAMLDSDNRVVGEFLRKAKRKESIVLKSQGLQERNYCYVSDTVTALLIILLKGESGKAYNIADRHSVIRIRDMAELLAEQTGTEVIFEKATEFEKKGYGIIERAVLDPSALEKLGWSAEYHLKKGLNHVLSMMEQESEKI